MLWQLRTRSFPYPDHDGPINIMRAVAYEHLRPSIDPNWSPLFKTLLQRCWKTNPHDRPNMDHILRVLRHPSLLMDNAEVASPLVTDDALLFARNVDPLACSVNTLDVESCTGGDADGAVRTNENIELDIVTKLLPTCERRDASCNVQDAAFSDGARESPFTSIIVEVNNSESRNRSIPFSSTTATC